MSGIKGFILIAGAILCFSALVLFTIYYHQNLSKARTIVLTTAVFSEMFLAFSCRSDKNLWKIGPFSNKFLNYSVLIAVILQIIAIYPPLSAIFEFKALSLKELAITIVFSPFGLIFFEIKKSDKEQKL